jgi:DNA polymerase-3 subunit beta
MEFTIDRKVLLDSLGKAAEVIKSGSRLLAVLNGVLITPDIGGKVTVVATNLDVSFRGTCPAQVASEGPIVLLCDRLMKILRGMKSKQVSFGMDEGFVFISDSGSRASLFPFSADEFPAVPFPEDKAYLGIAVDRFSLARMLDVVSLPNKAALDEKRPYALGVLADPDFVAGKLVMVSTDGFVLSVASCRAKVSQLRERELGLEKSKVIFPKKAFPIFFSMLGKNERRKGPLSQESVSILISEKKLFLSVGSGMIVADLLDGDYPDYLALLFNGEKISFQNRDMLNGIESVLPMTSEGCRAVRFGYEKGKISLEVTNPELGKLESMVKADVSKVLIGEKSFFDPNYIIRGLKALEKRETISVKVLDKDKKHAWRFDEEGDVDFTYLVMPMRYSEE